MTVEVAMGNIQLAVDNTQLAVKEARAVLESLGVVVQRLHMADALQTQVTQLTKDLEQAQAIARAVANETEADADED